MKEGTVSDFQTSARTYVGAPIEIQQGQTCQEKAIDFQRCGSRATTKEATVCVWAVWLLVYKMVLYARHLPLFFNQSS